MSKETEYYGIRIRDEARDITIPPPQCRFDSSRRTIAQADPNDFPGRAKRKISFGEVRVFCHDDKSVPCGVGPDHLILGGSKVHGPDMRRTRVKVTKRGDKAGGEILIEKQLHALIIHTLRPWSAANARQARMSSCVRSGKSARISSVVIPDAR